MNVMAASRVKPSQMGRQNSGAVRSKMVNFLEDFPLEKMIVISEPVLGRKSSILGAGLTLSSCSTA